MFTVSSDVLKSGSMLVLCAPILAAWDRLLNNQGLQSNYGWDDVGLHASAALRSYS